MTDLSILARAVEAVAADAGRSMLRDMGGRHVSRSKGRFDVQLDADLDAENAIVPRLRELVPGSEVWSEETGGPVDWEQRDVWIVDPLDGTNNYVAAVPYVAISIGFRRDRKLVLAVVRDPVLENSYSARLGCGAKKDGEPLFPGPGKDVSRSTVSLITDYSSDGRQAGEELYLKLNSVARRVTTLWAPAADLVRVATGHMDAVVCVRAGYGDVCSGLLILAEAGGVILDRNGKDLDVANLDPGGSVSFIAAASRDTAMKLREGIREEFDCYA